MPVQEGDELSVDEGGSAAGGAAGATQAPADASTGEALSLKLRFQDLLMSWCTSANNKRKELKLRGMYHGA